MSSINPETVVSVLKDQIENYDQKTEVKEEGRIIQIADGIDVYKRQVLDAHHLREKALNRQLMFMEWT